MQATAQKANLREELDRAVNSYFGSNFDYLSPAAKVMTAIAWDNYPDASYDKLVETIREFSPAIADSFSGRGISFQILSKGDSHKASGFEVTGYIACDTEEWYQVIPSSERIWLEDEQEELGEKVSDAIAQFEFDVCQEVEQYLEQKFGTTPATLVDQLSVQVKVSWGMAKGGEWCGADDEVISTFTTLDEAQNRIRQTIEMEHQGDESFDQDSVKQAYNAAFHLQVGQRVTVSEAQGNERVIYEYAIQEVE